MTAAEPRVDLDAPDEAEDVAATVAELVESLAARGARLSEVLGRCSYLYDGIAVRDVTTALRAGATIDVLPPFAGG